jgi:glucose/arabinose dehydrogenase
MFLSTLSLAIAMILVISSSMLAYSQTSPTHLFGCQQYSGGIHCDLLLNELEVLEVTGNSTLIHPVTTTETLFVDGQFGKALEMRGEYRESIEIMNSPELNPNQFTVSFWIKPTRLEPYGHVISHSNRAQNSGWHFDVFSSGNQSGAEIGILRFGVFNTNSTMFSPEQILIPADKFTLITGTFDGSTVRLYMDGSLVGETEFLGEYNTDPGVPIRIGSAAYCSSCNRWSGIIDEVQMYNRTLGHHELNQLSSMSDIPSGMIGYWKFDGDTRDTMQKNDGTNSTILTSMAFAPDGRLFFNEKNSGAMRIMTPEHDILNTPFATVEDVYVGWEQGMLGLAIDPEFHINHYVYAYYTALVEIENGEGGKVINRVLRFTDNNNTGTDPTIIMDNIPASLGYHSGGAMAFGTDGKLYITVGDATEHIFAQDPSIVLGKVLRINKDGSIPEDNPYPDSPVFTIGHRNMYGIAFEYGSGTGLITEAGDFHYDEINLITKGGNYGFPTLQPPNMPPERTNNSSIKPLRSYWDSPTPTQMIYYDGDQVPELKGMFLFGTYNGNIHALRMSDDNSSIVEEIKIRLRHFPFVPTVGIDQSPDGKVYYGGYQIYTLDSIGETRQILYTIEINAPTEINIGEISVNQEQDIITIDAEARGALSSDETLTARIPRALVDNITSVNVNGQQVSTTTEISGDDPDAGYTNVTLEIGSVISNTEDPNLTIIMSSNNVS